MLHCTSRYTVVNLATYSVQIWNAQIIEVRHNAASSVGAAEIISSRLAYIREVRRLLTPRTGQRTEMEGEK